MPSHFKPIAILGLVAFQLAATAPATQAADLGMTPRVHRVVHRSHGHWRVVADYDGTPIRLGPRRAVIARDYDGVPRIVAYTSEAYPLLNIDNPHAIPVPTRYLNGEPVRGASMQRF